MYVMTLSLSNTEIHTVNKSGGAHISIMKAEHIKCNGIGRGGITLCYATLLINWTLWHFHYSSLNFGRYLLPVMTGLAILTLSLFYQLIQMTSISAMTNSFHIFLNLPLWIIHMDDSLFLMIHYTWVKGMKVINQFHLLLKLIIHL